MFGLTGMAAATLLTGLGGATASIYGAHSAGKTQDKALRQSQSNLERDRRDRKAAYEAWQKGQAPVFQARQDALMAMLGRYEGPVGGNWVDQPAARQPPTQMTMGSAFPGSNVPSPIVGLPESVQAQTSLGRQMESAYPGQGGEGPRGLGYTPQATRGAERAERLPEFYYRRGRMGQLYGDGPPLFG